MPSSKGRPSAAGGTVPDGEGYFYPPTVLSDVPSNAAILQTEIFGPVAPVVTFTTEDEAIELANGTEYGLCFLRLYDGSRPWPSS